MNDENLIKKLGLYYHPLFQTIIQSWGAAMQLNENALDMITFIEINFRIQKAILSQVDYENSLSSALTDWIRELESLSAGEPPSPAFSGKPKKEIDILKVVKKMMETAPFDIAIPSEIYTAFFSQQAERLMPPIVIDRMSLEGFSKFIFDLCCSWCENLDIELFSIFLIAVVYQIINLHPSGQFQMKPFNEIISLPETLLTQIKLLKVHYNRYKKVDLTSYESWYEWNYLPNRINEIKTKVVEIFSTIFKQDEFIIAYVEGLYWTSIQQITQRGLIRPTISHFLILSKENIETTNAVRNHSPECEPQTEMNSSARKGFQKNAFLRVSNRVVRKPTIPVFGRSLSKSEQDEIGKTRTLKSIEPFIGDIDMNAEISDEKQMHLYPIWEQEVSETTSIATGFSADNPNPLKVNKNLRNLSREKMKRSISARKIKDDGNTLRGNIRNKVNVPIERMKLVEEALSGNPACFIQNFSLGKGRSSNSPILLDQNQRLKLLSPTWAAKNQQEIQIATRLQILKDKEVIKSGRASAPLAKKKLRQMAATQANFFNEVPESSATASKQITSDRKASKYFSQPVESTTRSSTACRSRHRGRIYKEMDAETTRQFKEIRADFTIFGKSKLQSDDEEDLLVSSREKYGLNLQAIDVEESEKSAFPDHHEKIDKLENIFPIKSPKVDLNHRAQSTRINRSPFQEFVNSALENKVASRGNDKIAIVDTFIHLNSEIKKESYSHIKLEFPKSTGTKPGFKGVKQEIDAMVVGKDLNSLFNKMKEKVEKNKRKQDIRMKRIKRPEIKQASSAIATGEKKYENILPDLMKSSYENPI